MHTDYVIWDPTNYFLPPPPSLMHRLVWALWALLCLTTRGCGYVDVAHLWDIYGRIELLRILRVGAPACGAHPPCLALLTSVQNPSIEYKNKTNSDTTATITSQTAHRLYSYTLHNICYRTL